MCEVEWVRKPEVTTKADAIGIPYIINSFPSSMPAAYCKYKMKASGRE
jgi:hypothetical protein